MQMNVLISFGSAAMAAICWVALIPGTSGSRCVNSCKLGVGFYTHLLILQLDRGMKKKMHKQ